MRNKVLIKEIFKSVQGEGPYIGVNQLFIRFSVCNLDCKYCDTDFKTDLTEYDSESLAKIINETKGIHSVSLTGGEPLMEKDFLMDLLPKINKKVYLETNGTLFKNLEKIIGYTDIISMDFKLNSASFSGDLFDKHEKFLEIAKKYNKEIFAKVVFDNNISNSEVEKCTNLAKKFAIELILQPKMIKGEMTLNSAQMLAVYDKFIKKYENVRLIGQMHKFINVE